MLQADTPVTSSPTRPITTRTRSSTLTSSRPPAESERKSGQASSIVPATTFRSISSGAAAQPSHTPNRQIPDAQAGPSRHRPPPVSVPPSSYPRASTSPTAAFVSPIGNHRHRESIDHVDDGLFALERATLALYTYKPSPTSIAISQPSPLPSTSSATPPSVVQFNHTSVPFRVRPGDYLEIRRLRRAAPSKPSGDEGAPRIGGEALKGVPKYRGRDGYVFRAGEDAPSVPLNQVQVPDSVATAFRLQHRTDVEVIRVSQGVLLPGKADL